MPPLQNLTIPLVTNHVFYADDCDCHFMTEGNRKRPKLGNISRLIRRKQTTKKQTNWPMSCFQHPGGNHQAHWEQIQHTVKLRLALNRAINQFYCCLRWRMDYYDYIQWLIKNVNYYHLVTFFQFLKLVLIEAWASLTFCLFLIECAEWIYSLVL